MRVQSDCRPRHIQTQISTSLRSSLCLARMVVCGRQEQIRMPVIICGHAGTRAIDHRSKRIGINLMMSGCVSAAACVCLRPDRVMKMLDRPQFDPGVAASSVPLPLLVYDQILSSRSARNGTDTWVQS